MSGTAAKFEAATAAEAEFYRAFRERDIPAMLALWDDAEDILCAHPMSPPLTGVAAVHESWTQLLSAGDTMQFTPRVIQIYVGDNLVMHHLWEQIRFGPDLSQSSLILATNAYRQSDSGWRMILHHGSPPGNVRLETSPGSGAPEPKGGRTVH